MAVSIKRAELEIEKIVCYRRDGERTRQVA